MYVVVGWFQLDPAIPENQSWSTIWVWDGFNWTKISPTNSPRPRAEHALAYDSANQQVVLFGGSGNLFQGHVAFSDTWTWDGSNWTEESPQTSPPSRAYHSMAYDSAHGLAVLFGGENFLGRTKLNVPTVFRRHLDVGHTGGRHDGKHFQ